MAMAQTFGPYPARCDTVHDGDTMNPFQGLST